MPLPRAVEVPSNSNPVIPDDVLTAAEHLGCFFAYEVRCSSPFPKSIVRLLLHILCLRIRLVAARVDASVPETQVPIEPAEAVVRQSCIQPAVVQVVLVVP